MIELLGDDGVPIEYHILFWKAETFDFVILQQDAFDSVDMMTPMKRQKLMLNLVLDIQNSDFEFDSFEKVAGYFKGIINKLKQMNYSEFESDKFKAYHKELDSLINERKIM